MLEAHAVSSLEPACAPATLVGMRAALAQMSAAADAGDRLALADAHRGFHVALATIGGNRQLSLVYDQVLTKIQLYMALNLRREAETTANPLDGVRRHARLLTAVKRGKRDEILTALANHGARSYLD